ncbi:hypothetical protein [Jeotgalibacillus campisalis]|uniref:Uncharacterized protein n=1 Tax=Jeotgalibacillus campisalis TaxID=220754 RepID=A0A0C2SA81_9BACL|nr:hypothetical protein [Jeotgalibacillus campisalis]KIL50879.1 hypothetical protein KR50_07600 [Jeotgalibacillus campisalis]
MEKERPKSSRSLVGIFICLLIIALKPVGADESVYQEPYTQESAKEEVVSLGDGRIAIVQTTELSGYYGEILVLEWDEERTEWVKVAKDNYQEYMWEER